MDVSQLQNKINNSVGSSSKEQNFDFMSVKDNIIDMGYRSISIPNIASITITQKSNATTKKGLIIFGIGMIILAFLSFRQSQLGYPTDNSGSIILGIIGAALLAATFLIPKYWYLAISTSDGATSLFSSKNVALLRRVKTALDEKIDKPEASRPFTVNFNEGSVNGLRIESVSEIKEMKAETVVSQSPGAMVASHSPAAQIGIANSTAMATASITVAVDYERYISGVEQFQRYVKERWQRPDIDEKVDEILLLMREGTERREDKSRLRELAEEIGQYVQTYQPLRQLFADIAAAAGQFL